MRNCSTETMHGLSFRIPTDDRCMHGSLVEDGPGWGEIRLTDRTEDMTEDINEQREREFE